MSSKPAEDQDHALPITPWVLVRQQWNGSVFWFLLMAGCSLVATDSAAKCHSAHVWFTCGA